MSQNWCQLAFRGLTEGIRGGHIEHGLLMGLASSSSDELLSKYGGSLTYAEQVAANAVLGGVATDLCKNGGTRTWNSSNHFGVGLGYTIYNNKGKDNLDVRASWAHSIGNTNWKQSQYESSVVYSPRRKGAATFALGYKHIHSHSSWMPHLNIVYGAIGFRF